ncbi:anhydro-N-acetylmuramic acid kinase [Herbiconiux flava]|uniref:Anhydro-N-acetylmuramic acid kinase n=1 Tax=Herbiconiux flava TaxID=881268 RepID=A0A852SM44_9MICO|nr:anhydro-N-acetylmuramic acid kinase [Herbiconiux flava]NYD69929.1 anhydro-N-acetylmuramic acid kinase [Herbiconiux flava]
MISGTSHDGIDVAVVDIDEPSGPPAQEPLDRSAVDGAPLVLTARVVAAESAPYEPVLRARLIAALPPAPTTFAEMTELDTLIGQAFAAAAQEVAAGLDDPVDLICSHGQTVFHWVEGGRALGTLQIGQPAWIAEALGVPVVSDVRIRDITAGGQGAPLVSFLDELLFRQVPGRVAALNLGGISNMTVLAPGEPPVAFDIGPANALIDAVIVTRAAHPRGYDEDGAIAATGTVDRLLLEQLLAEDYYALPSPKSTGKELFNAAYVDAALRRRAAPLTTPDLVATLTELTAVTVADAVRVQDVSTLVVSGGGWRNGTLVSRLRELLPGVTLRATDEFGAASDDKEAIAFALIGWCTAHGVPASAPSATGARQARVLGTITPGSGPLRLPEPVTTPLGSMSLTDARVTDGGSGR